MFGIGSKDTLLEPGCLVSSGYKQGSWKDLQQKGQGWEMLRTWERGQRLQRVETAGRVRNRKTGDAGL